MSIHEQKIVIVCRDQEEPVNVIEVFNALCIGWVDGEPARYFAPIHTSEPYSVVLANSAIGYCRFRDVDSLVAQGYEKRYAKEFVESANRWVIANAHLLPAGQKTALHAFDSRRERDVYDD